MANALLQGSSWEVSDHKLRTLKHPEGIPLKHIVYMDFKHPDGHIMYHLPTDPYHLPRYLARGFVPITQSTVKEVASLQGDLSCEHCGKTFSLPIALIGHRRTHKSKEKEEIK